MTFTPYTGIPDKAMIRVIRPPDLPLIRVDDIDYYTFNYEDIRYIYSDRMNQYKEEFILIKGFEIHAQKIIKLEKMYRDKNSPPSLMREKNVYKSNTPYKSKTPYKSNTPEYYGSYVSSINKQPSKNKPPIYKQPTYKTKSLPKPQKTRNNSITNECKIS